MMQTDGACGGKHGHQWMLLQRHRDGYSIANNYDEFYCCWCLAKAEMPPLMQRMESQAAFTRARGPTAYTVPGSDAVREVTGQGGEAASNQADDSGGTPRG